MPPMHNSLIQVGLKDGGRGPRSVHSPTGRTQPMKLNSCQWNEWEVILTQVYGSIQWSFMCYL